MATRVVLHVGTMKTATSYLQCLCQLNKDRLREQGVLWVGMEANFLAIQDFLNVSGRRPEHSGAWARLKEEVAEFPDTALISDEHILNYGPKSLKRLIKAMSPADVDIVVTARDLTRVLPSQWQTHIRSGRTTPWATYAEAVLRGPESGDPLGQLFWRQHNLPAAVSRCAQLVSPSKVTLVTVPPAGSQRQVIGDRFLKAVGASAAGFESPAYRKESLGVHSAEFARRLNAQVQHWPRADRREVLQKTLYSKVLENRRDAEPRLTLTPPQWEVLSDHAEKLLIELRAMNARVIGDLDDLLPTERPRQPHVDPSASTDSDLLAVAQFALVGLGELYAKSRSRRSRTAVGQFSRKHPAVVLRRSPPQPLRRWVAGVPGVRAARNLARSAGPRR